MRVLPVLLAVAACGKGAPKQDLVGLLAAHGTPTLVGPFAAIPLAADPTIADVRKVAPDLVREETIDAHQFYTVPAGDYAGASLRVERSGAEEAQRDTWHVGRLRMVFDDAAVKDRLVTAWGAPRSFGARAIWVDPAAKLRCVFQASDGREVPADKYILDCDAYTPLAELFGTDKVLFGFEGGTPLLGMTAEAVRARWSGRVVDHGSHVLLRPTELAERVTPVQLGDKEAPATVTWFKLLVSADQPTIEALLQAKLGAPRDDDNVGKIYRDDPRVVLRGSQIIVGVPPGE